MVKSLKKTENLRPRLPVFGLALLGFFSIAPAAHAGILDLTWTAPTMNADGTPLTDLASYRVYFGTSNPCPTGSPAAGLTPVTVPSSTAAPTATTPPVTYRLAGLQTGTSYTVAVTAVDTSGDESACSQPAGNIARADAATLVSPFGGIATPTPTYTWNAVEGATWYYLWVNDSTGTKIQQWYTASQASCGPGTGTCSVTPSTALANGAGQWWIQTWSPAGYGPWSSGMAFTINDPVPGAATLVFPSGTITAAMPTYTWNAVAGATWYYLWVNDSTGTKIQQWYTASQASCGSGTGTCSVTPSTALTNGAGQWWIQTWDPGGYGPWSSGITFTVSPPGMATLVSPAGTITTQTPTYTWSAVPGATWYYLWVSDSSAAPRITQWYQASDAGCAAGAGPCSVTPNTALAPGPARWWIQTWSSAGYGPWSAGMPFTVP